MTNGFGYHESAPRLETWKKGAHKPMEHKRDRHQEQLDFDGWFRDYAEFVEQDCPTLISMLADASIAADTKTVAWFWMWRSALWSASWLMLSGRDQDDLLEYWHRWEAQGRPLEP